MEAHLLKLLMGIREWTVTLQNKYLTSLGSGQSCSTPRPLTNRNVLSHSVIFFTALYHHHCIIWTFRGHDPQEGLCCANFQFYDSFKLFYVFTLNVDYQILSGYTDFNKQTEFFTTAQHALLSTCSIAFSKHKSSVFTLLLCPLLDYILSLAVPSFPVF